MVGTSLFSYPEFLLVALIGTSILLALPQEQQVSHLPDWLAQPAKSCLALVPQTYLIWLNKLLMYAGWRDHFYLGDLACGKVYLPILSLLLISILPLYTVLLITCLAWFAPDLILQLIVKRRQNEIYRSLPQALDLMVLCVDAGLGLDATLQKLARENSGIGAALNDELTILERDILLGIDREHAYQELYNRTGVDELKTLGSALNQASKLGLSIAKILRAQSEYIRKKQSQRAEEKAMKMPIYMAFPLWFFIMPTLMVLVLAPSLIKFYHQLNGAL